MRLKANHSDQSYRVEFVGSEHQPIVIVENFCRDPERLVTEAASLDFAPVGEYYPGVRSSVSGAYFAELAPFLGRVLREFFAHGGRYAARALYSLVTTPSDQLALPQRIPHVDSLHEGSLAVLHYLCRGNYGGTAFYRHRSTGFETIDAARHPRYMAMLEADFAKHGEPPPSFIQGDTPIFAQIARYDAVYNRALIYRSSLLHCGEFSNGVALPADVRVGRLTIASFLSLS